MSGWSCSGGGACFWLFLFCFVMVAKRPFTKLARFCFVFWCFGGAWVGRPHLKTGRSAREAVSPPISTKKININSGWGSCVVVRGWTNEERVQC